MKKRWNIVRGTSLACLFFLGIVLTLLYLRKEEVSVSKESEKYIETGISEKERVVQSYLDKMTLEEKVGQLFFARTPPENQLEMLETYHFGGYMLFARDFAHKNLDEVRQDLLAYQQVSRFPLLIASDEEGGTVTRISQLLDLPFPSPLELYQAGGLEKVVDETHKKADFLRDLGIHAGFFPVADVAVDPSSFMYGRTIGQDAVTTADYVSQTVKVLKEAKFVSTLKHFPGYGDNADTHTDLVYDHRSLEEFRQHDFLPFIAGIQAGADSIMVSHNIVTSIDQVPSSISPAMNHLIRTELGFEGVIMTDDFDMEGLAGFVDQNTGALQTIQAGTDMILSSSYATQIPYIIEQVQMGTITEERIDQSLRRILGMKYDLGLLH